MCAMLPVVPGMAVDTAARLRVNADVPTAGGVAWEPVVTGAEHVSHLEGVRGHGDDASPTVVDLSGLARDTLYTVRVPGAGTTSALIRTPPRALAGTDGLLFGLFSCYFPSDQYVDYPAKIVDTLRRRALGDERRSVPHVKILCGDQIYADVPAGGMRGDDIAAFYRARYERAWATDRLGAFLGHGANLFLPDDHEFWNSYPDRMLYLARTYGGAWQRWARLGAEACWQQQSVWNFAPGVTGGEAQQRGWCSTNLAGVDLFVADTRSDRSSLDATRCPSALDSGGACATGQRALMSLAQREALRTWVSNVGRLGVLVLGQPLLATSTSWWTYDTNLPDYSEYTTLLAELRAKIDGGASFIVLTGDIHWGRLLWWWQPGRRAKLVEFVSSPIARVATDSIWGTEYDVSEQPDIGLDLSRFESFNRHFGDFDGEKVFATNENNFGVLEIREDAGALRATFELWNLTPPLPEIAGNKWSIGSCSTSIDL